MLAHAGSLSLLALILGVNAVAAEYRHKTITDTYLAVPRRSRVIAAKLAAYTGVGFLFGVASVAVAVGATAVWLAVKDVPWSLADDDVWRTLVGILIVEGLLGQILGDYSRWLPMASGRALGNLPGDLLPQATGGLVLAGYAVVLAIIAAATSMRRDVT